MWTFKDTSDNQLMSVFNCPDPGVGGNGGDGDGGARGAGRSRDGLPGIRPGCRGDQQRLCQHGSGCICKQCEHRPSAQTHERRDRMSCCASALIHSSFCLLVSLHRTHLEVWHGRAKAAVDHAVYHRGEGGLLCPQ